MSCCPRLMAEWANFPPPSRRLLAGVPAEAILQAAEEENAEMIVMGTHGRTMLLRMVMGETAAAVVRGAACPVLTYKHRPT